jgi:tetratricopeptide (TPR) repeat protein
MAQKFLAPFFLVGILALSGCATPSVLGQQALRQGRYDEAAAYFAEAVAQDPTRLPARAGLGIARYKLGALDEAIDALGRVVAQAPNHREPRLYLGLSYLRKGEIGPAEEQLNALLSLTPHQRLASQIAHALQVLRVEPVPSEELRAFIAASLEHEVEWEREVRELQEAQRARPAYPAPLRLSCFRDRHGRVICL